jgi:hypothetical protein
METISLTNFTGIVLRKFVYIIIETGFIGQTDFVVVRCTALSSALPGNSWFRFKDNTFKVNRIWESRCSVFAPLFSDYPFAIPAFRPLFYTLSLASFSSYLPSPSYPSNLLLFLMSLLHLLTCPSTLLLLLVIFFLSSSFLSYSIYSSFLIFSSSFSSHSPPIFTFLVLFHLISLQCPDPSSYEVRVRNGWWRPND